MKTKIVYVLVSSSRDLFLEQLVISIYSLRKSNPTAEIIVVVDQNTYEGLKNGREGIFDYATVERINVPDVFSSKEKSRYLKTSLREYIKGDYLFIDTDTVVCGDLSVMDDLKGDIMAVLDHHLLFKESFTYNTVVERLNFIFGTDVREVCKYFNSGVMLVKDNERTHKFYLDWHNNWLYSCKQKSIPFDQPSLLKTDIGSGYLIKELGGEFNCQIVTSFKYLSTAKIIHFFQTPFWEEYRLSPFLDNKIYEELKKNKYEISQHLDYMIENVKTQITSPSIAIGYKEYHVLNSIEGQWIQKLIESRGFKYQILHKYLSLKRHLLK